jgi:hypothetical protein
MINFKFDDEAKVELEELRGYVRLKSLTETIRYALRFLRAAVDETQSGAKLFIERDGVVREWIPFWDERFKK